MNRFILLLSFSFLFSCTTSKIPFHTIKSKHTIFQDELTRSNIITTVYPGIPKIADEYLANGRINRNPKGSCFNSKQSYNYVNVSKEYVPLFRPYVIELNKEVHYRSVAGKRNSQFAQLYTEETKDFLKVKSKVCFKDVTIDGVTERAMIVSEIYSSKEK